MSYRIRTTSIDFLIPTESLPAALATLKDLNTNPAHDAAKFRETSGMTHYAWMPEHYDQQVTSTAEVFHMLGFATATTDAGLALTGYEGKIGAEEGFLAAVAHLVRPGSYIEWSMDDGDVPWRFEFDGEHLSIP